MSIEELSSRFRSAAFFSEMIPLQRVFTTTQHSLSPTFIFHIPLIWSPSPCPALQCPGRVLLRCISRTTDSGALRGGLRAPSCRFKGDRRVRRILSSARISADGITVRNELRPLRVLRLFQLASAGGVFRGEMRNLIYAA
ncbi:hypothetical protein EVAR_58031_1 [Eumeta japonica]|uniref:Uncharacterized protein n=1 Tax=Eumeta variegata TaxID=151549 RepID=A0A4C1ZGN1_EUMVA|nr:hypothetical protein EVAR_58031_1 [Eumeta japonica]